MRGPLPSKVERGEARLLPTQLTRSDARPPSERANMAMAPSRVNNNPLMGTPLMGLEGLVERSAGAVSAVSKLVACRESETSAASLVEVRV